MAPAMVFVHGAGRSGADDWPKQVESFPGAEFLTMPGYGSESPVITNIAEWVDRILSTGSNLNVVAHSFGGVASILAAARAPQLVRSLVLFEPAAYSYARGQPSVEAMIERMSPVMDRAPDATAVDHYVEFFSTLTGSRPDRPSNELELVEAERSRLLAPPWSFELPSGVLSAVPTLVVTGNWNDEYESIAHCMAELGAKHRQLVGLGHRPQDHPAANAAISDWIAGIR